MLLLTCISLSLHRIPFDWKTPFGYLAVWIFMYASLLSATFCITPILCLSFGSAWLVQSFANAITSDLNEFNDLIEKSNKHHCNSLNKHFCTIIQDFSELKKLRADFCCWKKCRFTKINQIYCFRLVHLFNDIVKFSVTSAFLWGMLALSGSMLSLLFVLVEYQTLH